MEVLSAYIAELRRVLCLMKLVVCDRAYLLRGKCLPLINTVVRRHYIQLAETSIK
jgi:hypothetical protein